MRRYEIQLAERRIEPILRRHLAHGGNFLFNYRYLSGNDLFLVYNQAWDTEGGLQQASRSLQLKVSYYWQR